MDKPEIIKFINEINEAMNEHMLRTMVRGDESIMKMFGCFHEAGVDWETITKAVILWAEKLQEENRENESRS